MQAADKAINLLRDARAALGSTVLPASDAQQRYACLMIINALGIVEREFISLLREWEPDPGLHERALAASIRAGQFDPANEQRDTLLRRLREGLRNQLAIDNPRLLDRFPPTSREPD